MTDVPTPEPERKTNDTVELSIRLSSGRFEMTLKHPIFDGATVEDFKDAVDVWLQMSLAALKVGMSEFEGTIEPPEQRRQRRGR